MISRHPAWRADRMAARAACVASIQRGCCRLTALVRSSFIQQVRRRGFCVFVKNVMALSSVGLCSAIQMEVKAATVQRLRSTQKLERLETSAPINAESEAAGRAEAPEHVRVSSLTNAPDVAQRSHKWAVILVDGT